MTLEMERLRAHTGHFLLVLFWAHVPLFIAVAWLTDHPAGVAGLAGCIVAGSYHLMWWRSGVSRPTRYLASVALMAEPAILLVLLQGHPWQMDMHMYFFALLTLTIGWADRNAVLVAAVTVSLHHLLLLYVLPSAVFSGQGNNLERVALHAVIVMFQATMLVWLSDRLVDSFGLRERTREAEEASRAKSLFLANMSHEIRTPMNAILGFCHLIARTELTAKQQDYVGKINQAGVSLLRLINDILDFSKNEAGKLTLEARRFDIRNAVANQLQLVAGEAEAKRVTIVSEVAGDIPHRLTGDELRFNQVVLNLVNNAVKFSEGGTVSVRVAIASERADQVMLELSVQDTGIGMTEEQQAGLFQSFTQADSSTTRRFGGTGLGLAICRQIVEQMGGSIAVKSALGQGTTFVAHMAMARESEVRDGPVAIPARIQALRVLAADDNASSRQVLQDIFAGWQIGLDLVASGDEALAAIRSANEAGQPYDLVLLDWKMPGMNGADTLEAMQDLPHAVPLPRALIVTAYGADSLSLDGSLTQVAGVLTKPVVPATLLDTMIELFSHEESPSAGGLSAAPARVSPRFHGARVLLVEDNEINRDIAIELLSQAGLAVDCAGNGRIGCERVEAEDGAYAAVLMDVQMPEMDGIAATRHLRERWSAERLPILAMTAHAHEEERQRCLAAGMNDHVTKPVDPALLIATLERWLRADAVASTGGVHAAGQPDSGPAREPDGAVADLPDSLPPFGLRAALTRVNGKASLLRKLIVTFSETYASAPQDLRTRIAGGHFDDARRLAHSLKGVAGSLELHQVQSAAAQVEAALAAGDADTALAKIAELETSLAPAIAAARSLQPASATAPHRPGGDNPGEGITAALQDLRDLVRRRSLGARAAFARYAAAAGLSDSERAAHPLHCALEGLDYDTALRLLDAENAGSFQQEADEAA
ncbi:hybrid sensor histidine kinase/response regulator [Novosphingobium soli]|uniref:histidine kinase n=1 Tax=Novosphingobium soli TaxID=574956 RepID=A0ABV6CU85_9SPHN